MLSLKISSVFFAILCLNLKTVISQRYEATLDPDGKFVAGWIVTGDRITFDLAVETKGWVGLGISDTPDMYDADLAIGVVYDNGTATIMDYFGQGPFRPSADVQHDLTLILGYESETSTFIRFSRLLDTGDAAQDRPITNTTTYLLYAFGVGDGLGYHGGSRGGYAVNLLNPEL